MSTWDAAKHPRVSAGKHGGGEFAHADAHGWIKAAASSAGLDAATRKANVERARTGVLKRAQRQQMNIGAGLGVAGGSSDIERPIAEALIQAVRGGKEHYVVPTAFGMRASRDKVSTSGYIQVTPQGEVTDWRRPNSWEPHQKVATMSDQTVAAILDRHLSKTQKYTPPAPQAKPPKKDPDVVPRSVVARLIKDIQKTPALQKPQYYQRAWEIASKSGALDLIPPEWNLPATTAARSGHESFVIRTRVMCYEIGLSL